MLWLEAKKETHELNPNQLPPLPDDMGGVMSNRIQTWWEWDGQSCIATYFVGTVVEIQLPLSSFKSAQDLATSIEHQTRASRYEGRAELLRAISRMEP